MSNLIPEPRVNKLGHTVTKHVRGSSPVSSQRLRLPSIAELFKPKDPAITEGVNKYRASIETNHLFTKLDKKQQKTLLKTLNKSTLETLAEHGLGLGDGGVGIPRSIIQRCIEQKELTLLNDLADYVEDYGTFTGETFGDFEPVTYLIGLAGGKAENQLYASFGFGPYSEATPEEREAQHAVLEATRLLEPQHLRITTDDSVKFRRIDNYDLVDYIKAHPEYGAKTAEIINKYGVAPGKYDFNMLDRISEAGDDIPDALMDGAL